MEKAVKISADCNFIMMVSSHVYNGSRNDCKVLSDVFGRTVVSCRNLACKGGLLKSLINIVEATFDNDSQIVVVESDGVPVFSYMKRKHLPYPDKCSFLDDNKDWQDDIQLLTFCAEHAAL